MSRPGLPKTLDETIGTENSGSDAKKIDQTKIQHPVARRPSIRPAIRVTGYSEGIYIEENLDGARTRNQKREKTRRRAYHFSFRLGRYVQEYVVKYISNTKSFQISSEMAQTAQPSQDSAKHRRPRPNGNMSKHHQRYLFSKITNKNTVHPAKFQVHGTKLIIPVVRSNRKRGVEKNQR